MRFKPGRTVFINGRVKHKMGWDWYTIEPFVALFLAAFFLFLMFSFVFGG